MDDIKHMARAAKQRLKENFWTDCNKRKYGKVNAEDTGKKRDTRRERGRILYKGESDVGF